MKINSIYESVLKRTLQDGGYKVCLWFIDNLDQRNTPVLEKFLKIMIDCRTVSSSSEMSVKHLLFFFVICNNLIMCHFSLDLKHSITPS